LYRNNVGEILDFRVSIFDCVGALPGNVAPLYDGGMRWRAAILLGAVGWLGCQQAGHVAPAVKVVAPAATQRADETRVMEVVEEKSPADAILNLAALLSKNARNVAYLQQLTAIAQGQLAAQVRALATQEDPEAMARAVRVLEFVDGMSRFLADSLAAGEDAKIAAWALEPEHAMAVAAAYDREAGKRAWAAHELAKFPGEQADALLARLIEDAQREVSLSAMDACWDRAASQVVVDALWNKVIVYGLRAMGANLELVGTAKKRDEPLHGPRQLEFRGRVLQDYDYYMRMSLRVQDGDVATDLLVHFKSELVRKRVAGLFEELGRSAGNVQLVRYVLSTRYGTVSRYAMQLMQAYKPPNAIPALLGLMDSAPVDGNEQTINGQACYFSMRADLIGFIVELADLDRETYHVARMQNWGASWAIMGGAKEEAEAVKRLKDWWKNKSLKE
jgi:hypothetical protein